MYQAKGYRFEEVGPESFRGKGEDAMRQTEEKLKVERKGGCPFALTVK